MFIFGPEDARLVPGGNLSSLLPHTLLCFTDKGPVRGRRKLQVFEVQFLSLFWFWFF